MRFSDLPRSYTQILEHGATQELFITQIEHENCTVCVDFVMNEGLVEYQEVMTYEQGQNPYIGFPSSLCESVVETAILTHLNK